MLVLDRIDAVRDHRAGLRSAGSPIGLVPTMGALHEGHARLIQQAREECPHVGVSIFVNPLQFDREDDLRRYPRTMDEDLEICRRLGVDFVFSPAVAEMYPVQPFCTVDVGGLADHLCGRFRPGHFRGVATVVLKLFEIAQPDRAYFGEKDAQQLAIIRRLVVDLNLPVCIVGVPTVREPDGLALSSRNRHLSPSERQKAIVLRRALLEADRQVAAGVSDVDRIKADASALVPADPSLKLEYLELVDPDDLQPVAAVTGPVLVAGALWVGSTRLIDNVTSAPPRLLIV